MKGFLMMIDIGQGAWEVRVELGLANVRTHVRCFFGSCSCSESYELTRQALCL